MAAVEFFNPCFVKGSVCRASWRLSPKLRLKTSAAFHERKKLLNRGQFSLVKSFSGMSQESIEFPEAEITATSYVDSNQTEQGAKAADVLEYFAKFVVSDLRRFIKEGVVTKERYSSDFSFSDPVTRIEGFDNFMMLMNSLRLLFKLDFDVHFAKVTGPAEITTKWTMYLRQEQLPWKPKVVLTGKSIYHIDIDARKIRSQVDEWDSASHNRFFSIEAAADLYRQATRLAVTPALESPEYRVLKRTAGYEVREYSPFVVAETEMDSGSGPAGGSGFAELARFLFGGNSKRLSMDMTTPVITSVAGGSRMQFVMGSQFASPEEVPAPESPSVACKTADPGVVAAIEFPGWPLDSEVVDAERRLRSALQRDGPLPGYQLARYNEPTTLPMLRRNEVLIKVASVQL
uniref:Soul heme-binding protein n=1 Tax=Tetraselmis sp. GSL018 TaxID=582737 RepID=A0A061S647_9CHLO